MSDTAASGDSGGDRISATVKWFNPIKGYGFVQPDNGTGDAFVHVSVLEAAGHTDLQDGAELECEIEQGPRGPMVSVIHTVTAGSAEVADVVDADAPAVVGVVKFFDPNKGYGFVVPEGEGGQDVFVSGRVVAQSGLRMLEADARVRVTTKMGEKGPLAVTIEVLEGAIAAEEAPTEEAPEE
ncbi:MAG: cold-shock protein [Alphaproteobacteria bacterium]|nr:cold-shock protein [Alphaproteobacteria bacterium]|tara:strand:+ start:894 stop:1439 length:546 start_codon:yes stop_codon:yes gene_type:complete